MKGPLLPPCLRSLGQLGHKFEVSAAKGRTVGSTMADSPEHDPTHSPEDAEGGPEGAKKKKNKKKSKKKGSSGGCAEETATGGSLSSLSSEASATGADAPATAEPSSP